MKTKLIPILSVVAAAIIGGATPQTASAATTASTVVAARDSGDSLWRRAREALSDGDYSRAAELFGQVRVKYPKSSYEGDSYYWQAFALSRSGGSARLKRALDLLQAQSTQFASAGTVKSGEARTLASRLRGQLARGGDAQAAEAVVEAAVASAGVGEARGGQAAGMARVDAERNERALERDAERLARAGQRDAQMAAADAKRAATLSATSPLRSMGGQRLRSGNNVPPGCKNEDDDDRIEALNALLQMNADQAMPILKKVLERRDACSELLRRKAVFLVAQKRGPETAELLLKAAKSDPDDETREQAVFWLSQVPGEQSEQLLEGLLRDSKDEAVQEKALFALSQHRSEKAAAALRDFAMRNDAPTELRGQAAFWLGQRKGEENSRVLRDLFGKIDNEEVREKILFGLAQQRGQGNEEFVLEQAMNAKLPLELRKQALFWSAQNGGVATAKVGAIYDKSTEAEMREQAIFVLSQRAGKDAAAVDKLIDIAKNEKDRELRRRAIFWVGQSKDPRAAKLLQELIDR